VQAEQSTLAGPLSALIGASLLLIRDLRPKSYTFPASLCFSETRPGLQCEACQSQVPPSIQYPMKIDTLKQFSKLRNALLQERSQLEQRLSQINALIGPEEEMEHAPASPGRGRRRGPRGRRRRSGISLREAIVKVTSAKPLTKEEILEAVKKIGYRFSTSKPLASINSYLYKKGDFVRHNGRFAPGKAKK